MQRARSLFWALRGTVSAGDEVDIVHRRGRLFPARSGTLWGAPGIPLHCRHAEGSRHLPVGVVRGRVKALSPHRQSRILSRDLPGLRLGRCSPRGR